MENMECYKKGVEKKKKKKILKVNEEIEVIRGKYNIWKKKNVCLKKRRGEMRKITSNCVSISQRNQ